MELTNQLLVLVGQLEARVVLLETELAKFRQPPPLDQKGNQSKKKRRKHGPPFGHDKYSRPLVENPDRVIVAAVEKCRQCQSDLSGIKPDDVARRQITELPEVKLVVIETQQHRLTCPRCRKV